MSNPNKPWDVTKSELTNALNSAQEALKKSKLNNIYLGLFLTFSVLANIDSMTDHAPSKALFDFINSKHKIEFSSNDASKPAYSEDIVLKSGETLSAEAVKIFNKEAETIGVERNDQNYAALFVEATRAQDSIGGKSVDGSAYTITIANVGDGKADISITPKD
ncbi:MAG: hypothetical protein WCH58_00875 [Candidatus Saccharibacteria bacterium]